MTTVELAKTGKILNERQGPTFPRVRGRTRDFSSLKIFKKHFMPLSILKAVFIMNSEILEKGGDFMGRVEDGKPAYDMAEAIRVWEWEGGRVLSTESASPVTPALGEVLNESSPITHPLRTKVVISKNGAKPATGLTQTIPSAGSNLLPADFFMLQE